MNRQVFILGMMIIVVSLIAASIIYIMGPATMVTGGVIDCGSDGMCFQEAAEACTPARMYQNGSFYGESQSMSMLVLSEVRGVVDGSCVIYEKVEEFRAENRSGIPEWVVDAYDEMEGAYMTCTVSQATGDAECSGPLERILQEAKPIGDKSLSMLDYYCEDGRGYAVFMSQGTSDVRLGDCETSGSTAVCGDVTVTKDAGSENFSPSFTDERISPGEITIFEDRECGGSGCIYQFTMGGEPSGTAIIYC